MFIIELANPHNGFSYMRDDHKEEYFGTGKYVKNTYGWQTDDINEAHTYQSEKGAKRAVDELTQLMSEGIDWDIKVPEDEPPHYVLRKAQIVVI